MPSRRTTAFIPIVSPGQATERQLRKTFVIEVYTEQCGPSDAMLDAAARDKHWDLIAAPLLHMGNLYRQACTAVGAVRKMDLKLPRFAFYQRYQPQIALQAQRLYTATTNASTEGQSAELGLALILMMNTCATERLQIFATGALSTSETGEDFNNGYQDHDVRVLPVSNLREKLKLVSDRIKQGDFPRLNNGKEWLFFTPVQCTEKEESLMVSQLIETHDLESIGVKVVPVGWLSDAVRHVNANYTKHLWQDRFFQAVFAVLLIGLLFIFWYAAWRSQPISKTFVPVPFQACYQNGDLHKVPLNRTLFGREIGHQKVLGWEVQVNKAEDWLERFVEVFQAIGYGYYFAFVIVYEYSDPLIITRHDDGQGPIRIRPNERLMWGSRLDKKIEKGMLVILAQHKPFDADRVRQTLSKSLFGPSKIQNTQTGQHRKNIYKALDALTIYDPHPLSLFFQVVKEGKICPEN